MAKLELNQFNIEIKQLKYLNKEKLKFKLDMII